VLTLAVLGLVACGNSKLTATPSEPSVTPLPPPTDAGLGDTWIRSATDGMVMVYAPGGEFEMGSDDDDVDYAIQLCIEYHLSNHTDSGYCEWWFENEQPIHTVALDGFWIDRTEVTNDQYRRCVEAKVCQAPRPYDWEEPDYYDASAGDHPVRWVTWEDAQTYCEWAGGRLPTEAEWAYAARGPQGATYPWGEDLPTCELAQFADCPGGTVPVGSFPDGVSWCGALDMSGNASEWVTDWYSRRYTSERQVNPTGPPRPSQVVQMVVRGSGWYNPLYEMHSARRTTGFLDYSTNGLGFRCVWSSK